MSGTGLKVFDTTLQETHRWLHIVMAVLETDSRRLAFDALRAGLHALRDRIGPEPAVHLGAQLPMLLRGAYYEGWKPSAQTTERHADAFLEHIAALLPPTATIPPEEVLRATLTALAEGVDPGAFAKTVDMLPEELKALIVALAVP